MTPLVGVLLYLDSFLLLDLCVVRTPHLLATLVALAGVMLGYAPPELGAQSGHGHVDASQRKALLQRAQIWKPTDLGSKNIVEGPRRKDAFKLGETVTCDYVDVRLGGSTPKFACELTKDDVLKVRYGRDNGEVYAGVATTRLLWALGFGANAMYPVQVICRKCPQELGLEGRPEPGQIRFDIATIERKMPGREIEAPSAGPGWAWSELDQVDEAAGGAPLAHRDALKLLAVLLQHTDSKADQQKLLCLDGHDAATLDGHESKKLGGHDSKKLDSHGSKKLDSHGSKKDDGQDEKKDAAACKEPFLMIHDVGQTFGHANLFNRTSIGSVNLKQWSSAPVWKDAAHCVGNLPPSQTGTLADPVISEAGRKFLSDLLAQLTDDQLRDLFRVARFADKPGLNGTPKGATVDEWVAAFKMKRDEIAAAHCIG